LLPSAATIGASWNARRIIASMNSAVLIAKPAYSEGIPPAAVNFA